MRNKIIWIIGVPLMLIIILAGVARMMFGSQMRAANSVTMLTDGLYYMEFEGDDGVDEALEQLAHVNMHSDIDKVFHLALADVWGKSVVVEYVDGQMRVKNHHRVRQFPDSIDVFFNAC